MTPQHKRILDKHYLLYLMFKNERAIPSGSSIALQELALVRQELKGQKTNLYCSACITEMMHTLYHNYQPEPLKEDGKESN